MFLLGWAQKIDKKLVLVVDEVATIENDGLAGILAQARKFGLAVYLSGQYLDQISTGLLSAILANVYNYFVFRVSDGDAKVLSNNIQMVFREGENKEESKMEVLTRLDSRQCVARLFKDGKFYPGFVGKTVDI